MKKVRKGKKMLVLIAIAAIVIIAAIFIVVKVVNKKAETPGTSGEEQQQVIPLPETTYSEMEVKNIQMEYLKNNNETMVTMSIFNTTSQKVEDENLDAILIGPDQNILGRIQTYIQELDVGEQYDISVILKGDLTSAEQIKLEKK